jgi:hypothetical protein
MMRRFLAILPVLVLWLVALPPAARAAWKFGVISDTQWTVADDGANPNSVAVDIINQVNEEMIRHQVKFVIAVGDITDKGNAIALDTRATYAQALYNAGVGFFPLRGNHEKSPAAAKEFQRIFPQTQGGQQNMTPPDALVTTPDDARTQPARKTGPAFALGTHFSSPRENVKGLSYAFDYENARFVLMDQHRPLDNGPNSIDSQQEWINKTLADKPAGGHAFVFGHEGVITEHHADTLFGANPAQDPAGQDAFIASLQKNGVRYYMGGHDHMHNRALVTTTDGKSAQIEEIIAASDSSKFYTPAKPSHDEKFDVPAFGHTRESPISQDLERIGYYLFSIDGPRVTVDYYGVPGRADGKFTTTPPLRGKWQKVESFGYSLNGKEFIVRHGESYTSVQDKSPAEQGYFGTTARILDGSHKTQVVDHAGRVAIRTVETGWTSRAEAGGDLKSDVLTLWGMAARPGSAEGDEYVLALSFDTAAVPVDELESGRIGIVTRDAQGKWTSAAGESSAKGKKFVRGPYQPDAGLGLGAYGIDAAHGTAWVVLNHGGEFAVGRP